VLTLRTHLSDIACAKLANYSVIIIETHMRANVNIKSFTWFPD